jgi:hypothetical protein
MQLVQTTIFLTWPLCSVLTRCRFGLNRRLVTLWAWLILLPTIGFLPHISHILDIPIAPYTVDAIRLWRLAGEPLVDSPPFYCVPFIFCVRLNKPRDDRNSIL